MSKSILFTDAVIHTGRTESETASSMLVKNGIIQALDPADAGDARRVGLAGRHVYPCLIDGHVHLLSSVVLAAQGFQVCQIKDNRVQPDTIAKVAERLRAFAQDKPRNAALVGTNYIATAIRERRLPTRQELDEWCGGRAVTIYTIDGHASSLSTAMLKKVGINPEGHSGILMGEEHERMQGRITDALAAAVTPAVLARGMANFQNACAGYGISCVGALEGNGDSKRDLTTRLIVLLARHFSVDVRFYFQYFDINKAKPFAHLQNRKRIGGCGDWEMDGASGAHSAAFSLPYRDTGMTSPCYYTQEQVNEAVRAAEENGYQIASHAIGDAAIDRILTALRNTNGRIRHRIEHCEFASDEAIEEIARKGYAVMAQPGYSWIDKRFLHTYDQYLPDEMIARLRFKTFVDKGVCICGSTDSPVQEIDPWEQILGMTQFYNESESITPYQALRCYTVNAAKAIMEEDRRGMLLPGMRADFFTGTQDIYRLSPDKLCSFRPEATYYLGQKAKVWKGTVPEMVRALLGRPKKV